jgi:phage shock protein C
MKKVVTIHILGDVFQMEEDGYNNLQNVLRKVAASSPNGTEISKDVEQRVGQQLRDKASAQNGLITDEQVMEVLTNMGFGGYLAQSEPYQSPFAPNYGNNYKRLYRHPFDKMLGGVCGGVAAYVKADPVLIRIVFVILFFGFGSGLLLYLIMWIVVPIASTPEQLKEMQQPY